MAKHIAIIGGGLAGLAAATHLASHGYKVSVFEANGQLGGRARSIHYQGTTLDNGQHIMLGAYHETLRLLTLAGVDTKTVLKRLPLALTVNNLLTHHSFALKTPKYLPAPFHLLAGLLSAKGVSLKDKWHTVRCLAWMQRTQFKLAEDEPLHHLLLRHQQTATMIQYLWEPLCLAALNTPLHLASAQVFLNVLKDSFSKKKQDADLLLPAQDLSQLLSEPLAHFITARQGNIYTNTTIKNITFQNGLYILGNNEQTWSFSHVIVACGPHQLTHLAHDLTQFFKPKLQLTYQPITTIYLQYPTPIQLPSAMIGSVNSLSQWIFDRGQLTQQYGLIAVVISAHSTFKQTQSELANSIALELLGHFPGIGKPLWHKVVTEKRATFNCAVGLNRPSNRTPYPGLFLAGDYTASDYPATIEGAIRSGITAATLCEV